MCCTNDMNTKEMRKCTVWERLFIQATVLTLMHVDLRPVFWSELQCKLIFLQLIVGHRVVILQTIELIVKTKIDDISYLKIKSIISLASDEMTRSKVRLFLMIVIRSHLKYKVGLSISMLLAWYYMYSSYSSENVLDLSVVILCSNIEAIASIWTHG